MISNQFLLGGTPATDMFLQQAIAELHGLRKMWQEPPGRFTDYKSGLAFQLASYTKYILPLLNNHVAPKYDPILSGLYRSIFSAFLSWEKEDAAFYFERTLAIKNEEMVRKSLTAAQLKRDFLYSREDPLKFTSPSLASFLEIGMKTNKRLSGLNCIMCYLTCIFGIKGTADIGTKEAPVFCIPKSGIYYALLQRL